MEESSTEKSWRIFFGRLEAEVELVWGYSSVYNSIGTSAGNGESFSDPKNIGRAWYRQRSFYETFVATHLFKTKEHIQSFCLYSVSWTGRSASLDTEKGFS